jgi:hypothetical protein
MTQRDWKEGARGGPILYGGILSSVVPAAACPVQQLMGEQKQLCLSTAMPEQISKSMVRADCQRFFATELIIASNVLPR